MGDPTRAALLTVVLDGRAYTSGELARLARVSPATASSHLAQLLDAGMITMAAQGRHRYYRLAGPDIAAALESLAYVSAAKPVRTLRASAAARALQSARSCYDHIAGGLGVAVHDHLARTGGLVVDTEGVTLTTVGETWFTDMGVDVTRARATRRPSVRLCLDWTERRYHLAGSLPAALLDTMLADRSVVRRSAGERGLDITADGWTVLRRALPDFTPTPTTPTTTTTGP